MEQIQETMFQLRKYVAILFLINSFYNGGTAGQNIIVTPITSQISFTSNNEQLFYVTCDRVLSNGIKSKTCDFNLQTRKGDDAFVKSCYDIPVHSTVYFDAHKIISDTKVLILYNATIFTGSRPEPSVIEYKVLDFVYCSLDSTLEIPLDPDNSGFPFMYLSVTNEAIDLFISNVSPLCKGENEVCIIPFNLQGKQLGEPKRFPASEVYHAAQVNDQAPEKGHYVKGKEDPNWIVLHIDSTGRVNQLLSTPYMPYDDVEHDLTVYSNSYELYGFCTPHTSEKLHQNRYFKAIHISCMQFDTQGVKLNSTLQVGKNTLAIDVHNLPNSEMLLATANVEQQNNGTAVVNSITFYKINKDGPSFNSLTIKGVNLKYTFAEDEVLWVTGSAKMRIYERNNNQICVDIACQSPLKTQFGHEFGSLEYDVQCIEKEKLINL